MDKILIALLVISPIWVYVIARLVTKGVMRSIFEEIMNVLDKLSNEYKGGTDGKN